MASRADGLPAPAGGRADLLGVSAEALHGLAGTGGEGSRRTILYKGTEP